MLIKHDPCCRFLGVWTATSMDFWVKNVRDNECTFERTSKTKPWVLHPHEHLGLLPQLQVGWCKLRSSHHVTWRCNFSPTKDDLWRVGTCLKHTETTTWHSKCCRIFPSTIHLHLTEFEVIHGNHQKQLTPNHHWSCRSLDYSRPPWWLRFSGVLWISQHRIGTSF